MSGTASGSRNVDVIKTRSLSSRNCLIVELGQEFRSSWPWAAVNAVRGICEVQRMEGLHVAGRPGKSPWRQQHWAGWWKSWVIGAGNKEDRPHTWMVLNLIPPHPVPDRTDVPIQCPHGCHLDLVSVHLHSSQPEGPNLRSLTHMQIPLT